MRLTEHLWVPGQPQPIEYTKYKLRKMYQVPPSVLEQQTGERWFAMMQDLKCEEIETKARSQYRSLKS